MKPCGINYCILLIAFAFCSAAASDNANSTDAPIRTLEKITDDLFRYQYAHHVSMVLNTPEGLLITDPSSKEAMISLKVELEARFDKPVRYMVYSHHHPDHIGGASVFAADTTIIAHEDTRRILAAETIDLARLPLPDVTFAKHMMLSLGGKTVELFPVRPRTHAEGMIAIRFVEDRTLYAVDIVVIEGMAWMNLNNTRFPAHIDTIKNLETLDFDYFASGHYRVSTKKEIVEVCCVSAERRFRFRDTVVIHLHLAARIATGNQPHLARFRIVPTTISLLFPYSSLRRHFGIQTTWYLQSHTECARFLNRWSI